MAYVLSGNCFTLTAYYTQLGRERLITGEESNTDLVVTRFGLSDRDINYETDIKPSLGRIPDISGQIDGCINSIASGITITSNIRHLPE